MLRIFGHDSVLTTADTLSVAPSFETVWTQQRAQPFIAIRIGYIAGVERVVAPMFHLTHLAPAGGELAPEDLVRSTCALLVGRGHSKIVCKRFHLECI
jgi:hypothetical protein